MRLPSCWLGSYAIRQGGQAVCWGAGGNYRLGDNSGSENVEPGDVLFLDNAIEISAGNQHSCAIRQGGQAVCWGEGGDYRLGNNDTSDYTTLSNVSNLADAVSIVAGERHTCAIRSNGQPVCWGDGAIIAWVIILVGTTGHLAGSAI